MGHGIFAAQVDEATACTDRERGNQHALDQAIRIAFHGHTIGEGAGIAFVGIADDVFLRRGLVGHGLPLDAARKRRAAATAQARFGDCLDDVCRRHGEGAFESVPAAVRAIVIEVERIDDAVARETHALLLLEPGDVLDPTEGERVLAGGGKAGIEKRRNVFRVHRPETDAPCRSFHLDQRLEPTRTSRPIPHDGNVKAPNPRLAFDSRRDTIRPARHRTGIARHENANAHGRSPQSSISVSMRSTDSRPCTRSSSIADGAQAQLPRQ